MTGLIAALVSAMVYGVGLTVEQRALHRSEPIGIRRPLHLARVLFGNPRWLAGCVLAALGSVGLIVSLGLAPVSVVQPTFAGGISLTLLLLSLAQQQRISRGELAALGIMPVALLLLALSLGPRDAAAGTVPHLPLLLTADHGLFAALVPVLLSPFPYLYALGWAVGIALFQTSMQRSRASITAPAANVVGNVFTVVAGTVIFAEPLPTEPLPLVLRALGFLLTLTVVALVHRASGEAEAEAGRLRAAAQPTG